MTWSTVIRQWSFDPSVVVPVVVVAVLYLRGAWGTFRRINVVGSSRANTRKGQAVAFGLGLIVVLLALESPIDYLSAYLFWPHMIQHLLLIMVAGPLLVLGDPSVPMLRGLPLGLRRQSLPAILRQRWIHAVGRAIARINTPIAAFSIFMVDLYLWHWNWLFVKALQNQSIHDLEHFCFLTTALLFWSQVVDQRPVHAKLSYLQRAFYVVFSGAAGNVLAMYFVFAPRALYAPYVQITPRPFGMTALADQQLAGAIMWIPVLFLFGGAFAIFLYKWLGSDDPATTTPVTATSSYSVLLNPGERAKDPYEAGLSV